MAQERLAEYLVRTIRMWRPDVVLTTWEDAPAADGFTQLLGQALPQALEQAGSPAAYTQQIDVGGLQPWRVRQVLAHVDQRQPDTQTVPIAQLVLPLGRSVSDLAQTARGLLFARPQPVPELIGYQAILGEPGRASGVPLLESISLTPGMDGRRPEAAAAGGSIQQLQRVVQLRRNIDALVGRLNQQADGAPGCSGDWPP